MSIDCRTLQIYNAEIGPSLTLPEVAILGVVIGVGKW